MSQGRTVLPVLAALVAFAACRDPSVPPPHASEAYLFIADGDVHTFANGSQERVELEATLATMGAAEIGCPTGKTRTGRVAGSGVACAEVWVAEGCGRRTSYVVFTEDSRVTERVPGHPGEPVLAHVEGIARMSDEQGPAIREIAKAYERIGLGPSQPGAVGACFPTWIEPYFVLQADGARDLACPRTEVVPMRFSRGQMAEGCGKRASYWGDRLSSIVPFAAHVGDSR